MKYYLSIDIGASSGRHILGKLENGKLELTEIYRFENGYEKQGEKLVWNIDKLFKNIVEGIKKCNDYGVVPYSIGIDTWGVDYSLLDENGNIIENSQKIYLNTERKVSGSSYQFVTKLEEDKEKGFKIVRTGDREMIFDIRNHKYEYE